MCIWNNVKLDFYACFFAHWSPFFFISCYCEHIILFWSYIVCMHVLMMLIIYTKKLKRREKKIQTFFLWGWKSNAELLLEFMSRMHKQILFCYCRRVKYDYKEIVDMFDVVLGLKMDFLRLSVAWYVDNMFIFAKSCLLDFNS